MKTLFLIISFLLSLCVSGQNELVNTFIGKHTLYGGPSLSATCYTYNYILVAKEEVEMVNIEHEGRKLILQAGDTLIVVLNTNIPDETDAVTVMDSTRLAMDSNTLNDSSKSYKTNKIRGKTCVYIDYRYEFDFVCTYSFRNHNQVAIKKTGFDTETEMCGY